MLLKVKVSIPLLFFVSILPDIDLFFGFLMHRGLTHSLIAITAFSLPFFVVYRKRMIPYYLVLLSHVLVGDLVTGGSQLFWPLTESGYVPTYFDVKSTIDASIELILFMISLSFMVKLKDLSSFFSVGIPNITLVSPFVATLGPLLQTAPALSFWPDFDPPDLLVVPSLFFLALFATAIVVELRQLLKSTKEFRG